MYLFTYLYVYSNIWYINAARLPRTAGRSRVGNIVSMRAPVLQINTRQRIYGNIIVVLFPLYFVKISYFFLLLLKINYRYWYFEAVNCFRNSDTIYYQIVFLYYLLMKQSSLEHCRAAQSIIIYTMVELGRGTGDIIPIPIII